MELDNYRQAFATKSLSLRMTCDLLCAHLQGALQGPEKVDLLIDDRVLAASNERSPEVVMSERLLLSCQRHASFLYAVHHRAHLIHW